MPSDDGLRLENFHRVQHLGSQVIKPRKHQAIDIADGRPLGRSTPQHIELMPRARTSVCKAARDRNSPATAYQINLRRSPIAVVIDRFAGDRQLFCVYGRYRGLSPTITEFPFRPARSIMYSNNGEYPAKRFRSDTGTT
jgi:hypothetical protein